MIPKPLILVVDDEPAILKMLQGSLEDEGFRVETLSRGNAVLETIGKLVGFIEKPFTLADVLEKLAFTKQTTSQAIPETPIERSYLVGESALFHELLSQARILAPLPLPVIIYGPSGCGKAALARYIHDMSQHADAPFIIADHTTILALNDQQLANTATLLVKHLDKADEAYQERILDIICNYPHIRVIASSASSLFSRMQQGLFDSSLFCKLNVTPLEIAAINKRRYDIPLLINNFLHDANNTHGTSIMLSTDAIRLLRNHQWTGDIAQIKQFIERLVAQATHTMGSPVTITALQLKNMLPECPTLFFEEQSYTRFDSLDTATHEFQREYVSHLLKKYRYDINQLAEFLNISVDTLHDTMHKLHITLH